MSMSPKSAESSLDAIVVAEGRFGPYSALEHPRSFFIDHRIAAFPVMTNASVRARGQMITPARNGLPCSLDVVEQQRTTNYSE